MGEEEVYNKKDVRLLFNVGKDGEIIDFKVFEFITPCQNDHYYSYYKKDIGNCNYNWNEWQLQDVLIKFLICYWVKQENKVDFLKELSRVKEWSDVLAPYIESIN